MAPRRWPSSSLPKRPKRSAFTRWEGARKRPEVLQNALLIGRTSEDAMFAEDPFHALGRINLFEALSLVAAGDVEHHHANHDQGYPEDVHRPQDLLPDQQPQQHRAYRSEPRPYGVGDP